MTVWWVWQVGVTGDRGEGDERRRGEGKEGRRGGGNVRTNRGDHRGRRASFAIVGTLVALSLATGGAPAGAAGPSETMQEALPGQRLEFQASEIFAAPGKPSTPSLDSRLDQLAAIERREGAAAARRFADVNAISLDAQGRANILIHQSAQRDYYRGAQTVGDDQEHYTGSATFGEEALFELLEGRITEAVRRLGGTIRGRVSDLVDASVPIANLRELGDAFGVGWLAPALTRRGTVVSQGVNVIQAAALQSSSVSYQPTDPVRVGVVDLGFKGYQDLLGSDLPPSVTVNSFHPGGIDGNGEEPLDQIHGTACAEIVFDVAPEVELFLANFDTAADNAAAFDWMIEQNVDVITYSIGWFNAGPGDGRGVINDPVQRALDRGIAVTVAAGNAARTHWEGQYSDPDGDGFNNFAPNDESNAVFLNAGEDLVVFLNWDDWFASAQDYDLLILDEDSNIVAFSTSSQTGTQEPIEATGFTAQVSGVYHVIITRFSATRDVNLEMFFFVDREMQYIVPAGSITIPADSDGAVAVGATFWGDDVIEFFSSHGPTTDGRIKPDLTAPDGVSTVSYGDLGLAFFGTSASAPHAAGAIALMKSRFGVFSVNEIRDILYGRAIDRGLAGMDNIYGRGRLDVIGQ